MELDELKDYWKLENEKLKERIQLNESVIKKGYLDKTVSEVDLLIKTSILGRNLALVYALISFVFTIILIKQIEFSIPCFLAGLAMLWSFKDHLVITRPKYFELPIVELQKVIEKFRIHTSSRSIYDLLIVFVWFVTIIPAWIKIKHETSVYLDSEFGSTYFLIIVGVTLLLIIPFRFIYKNFENKLKAAENSLTEILAFEKP
jgi:hypothetical protein